MNLLSLLPDFAGAYGKRLSVAQKAALFVRRKLARPTRWDRAAQEWRAANPAQETAFLARDVIADRTPDVTIAPDFAGPARESADAAAPPRIAVICHLFYDELAADFAERLRAMPVPYRLCVTTDRPDKRARILAALEGLPNAALEVRVVPNVGRDIAPKLVGFADVHREVDLVLHVHGKKSLHASALHGWREHILDRLIGRAGEGPGMVEGVLALFAADPGLGMLTPAEFRPGAAKRIGHSGAYMVAMAEALGRPIDFSAPLPDHPSGSMFWARTAALAPMLDLNLGWKDFGAELRQYNGTLAHGVEHTYGISADIAGLRLARIARPGDANAPEAARRPADLTTADLNRA